MKREPIFGPNAKPFFFQLALGFAVSYGLYEIGLWHFVYDLTGVFFD